MYLLAELRIYPEPTRQISGGGQITLSDYLPEGTYYENTTHTVTIPAYTKTDLVVKNGDTEVNRIAVENDSANEETQTFDVISDVDCGDSIPGFKINMTELRKAFEELYDQTLKSEEGEFSIITNTAIEVDLYILSGDSKYVLNGKSSSFNLQYLDLSETSVSFANGEMTIDTGLNDNYSILLGYRTSTINHTTQVYPISTDGEAEHMSFYTLGIDIGSTASKCVILADGRDIVAKSLIAVGAGTSGPQRAIDQVLENAGMKEADMAFTLATGYGRNSLEGIADYQMSELSCHAKGASFLFPDVHTVIDIGGQDVKVLQIENGVMTNFVMNDKCAAGTGRFLDVMARVLEVKVEELGDLGAQSTRNLSISSTCTVFAESEVISQLAQGSDKRDIINGIHHSVASRVAGLAHRVGAKELVVMTGGVAQNTGVVKALEEELGRTIHTSPLTQYNGALGAALFAYDRYKRAHKA